MHVIHPGIVREFPGQNYRILKKRILHPYLHRIKIEIEKYSYIRCVISYIPSLLREVIPKLYSYNISSRLLIKGFYP
jgi:hypothetical protein